MNQNVVDVDDNTLEFSEGFTYGAVEDFRRRGDAEWESFETIPAKRGNHGAKF